MLRLLILSILAVLAGWLYWKDDTTAMTELGHLYEIGLGVPQDYGKAREWYEKAAAKDDAAATYVGRLYENGLGMPQDYGKAREWYEKAAAKGDLDAKARLEKWGTR